MSRRWVFRIEVANENDCCDKQQAQEAKKQIHYVLGPEE